jgi:hypothetical protein
MHSGKRSNRAEQPEISVRKHGVEHKTLERPSAQQQTGEAAMFLVKPQPEPLLHRLSASALLLHHDVHAGEFAFLDSKICENCFVLAMRVESLQRLDFCATDNCKSEINCD